MKISLLHFTAIVTLLGVVSGAAAKSPTPFPAVKPDPQAVAAATKWLAVVDAGNYSDGYDMFPPRITRSGDAMKNQWVGFLRARRSPLGRPLSRKLVKAQFSHTLAGAPDGNYEFLTYNTALAHKAQTTEMVTLTKESGHWQVSGYHFN
jgi:hypothetical protein